MIFSGNQSLLTVITEVRIKPFCVTLRHAKEFWENVNICEVHHKYFRKQNQFHYVILNKKMMTKWGIVTNNLYLDKPEILLFKMYDMPPYLVNHKTSCPWFGFSSPSWRQCSCFLWMERKYMCQNQNGYHRCGNRASAYFLDHNCLAFGQKSFASCILFWWVLFWKDWGRANSQHSGWKIKVALLHPSFIFCGEN